MAKPIKIALLVILIAAVIATGAIGLFSYYLTSGDDELPPIAQDFEQAPNFNDAFDRHVRLTFASTGASSDVEQTLASQGFEIEKSGVYVNVSPEIRAIWTGHRFPCDHVIEITWSLTEIQNVSDLKGSYGLICP